MSASAHPKLSLRPFLPQDAPILAELFRASVEELTSEDYDSEQQDAWASAADDEEAFADRLGKQLTLIAILDRSTVGFISLAGKEHIDMLYVHPVAVGRGVGTMLLDAIEKLAAARGATKLTADASDTALSFFTKRGFVAKQRNTVSISGEWLANTTVEKTLSAPGGQG
jgi:putative acetyltransferase